MNDNTHRFDDAFLIVSSSDSRQALRVQEPDDMGAYAHCTAAGKTLLAQLNEARRSTFIAHHPLDRHTRSTLTTRTALDRELAQVRAQGFAQTCDELCEVSAPTPFPFVIRGVPSSPPSAPAPRLFV